MPELNFDPNGYLQGMLARRQAQNANSMAPFNSANQAAQTIGGIGQDILARRQQAQEMQRQQQLMQLSQQQGNRTQQDWQTENSPLVPPHDTSQQSYGQPDFGSSQSQSPQTMPASMPQQPQQPPQGQSSPMLGSSNPSTGNISPHVAAHIQQTGFNPLNLPVGQSQSQGQPQGQTQDPEQPYLKILQDPSETPKRQQLAAAALERMTQEEKTPFEIPMAQAQLQKAQGEAQAAGGVSPQDWQDMQNNNAAGIASRHNGVIPTKLGEQMATMGNQANNRYVTFAGKYQPQIQAQQKQINDIDATLQGLQSGDAGQIESAQGIVSSALKLSPRLAKEAGGQSYASELGEWASGKLGNQAVPPELMKPLVHIINLQKTSAQASLNQIQASALGEAANLRLDPKAVNSLFSNPAIQTQQPSQSTNRMTAKNPKTGQRIQSLDGGKTWQPIQ